jgi:hypothetical protein
MREEQNSVSVWLGTGSSVSDVAICQGGGKLQGRRGGEKGSGFTLALGGVRLLDAAGRRRHGWASSPWDTVDRSAFKNYVCCFSTEAGRGCGVHLHGWNCVAFVRRFQLLSLTITRDCTDCIRQLGSRFWTRASLSSLPTVSFGS